MKVALQEIRDWFSMNFHSVRENGMELVQFVFVLAICVFLAGVAFSVLRGSFQPGLNYVSHLSEGAFTTDSSGKADFNKYM